MSPHTPKRGRGRPRLGKQTVRVELVVDAAQLERWDAAAAAAGQTRSEWIRERLDEAAERNGAR
jgi:hypothetical protein